MEQEMKSLPRRGAGGGQWLTELHWPLRHILLLSSLPSSQHPKDEDLYVKTRDHHQKCISNSVINSKFQVLSNYVPVYDTVMQKS